MEVFQRKAFLQSRGEGEASLTTLLLKVMVHHDFPTMPEMGCEGRHPRRVTLTVAGTLPQARRLIWRGCIICPGPPEVQAWECHTHPGWGSRWG